MQKKQQHHSLLYSVNIIPLESEKNVAITLPVDGRVRNFLDGGETGASAV